MGLPFIRESLKFLSDARRGWPKKFIHNRTAKFSSHVFKTSLFEEPMVAFSGAQGNKFLLTNENRLVGPWLPSCIQKLFPLPDNVALMHESKKLRKIFHNELVSPKSYDKLVKVMDVIAQKHFVTCWENEELVKVHTLVKSSLVCKQGLKMIVRGHKLRNSKIARNSASKNSGADGDTINHSSKPMAQMSGNSIGDSNIENMNRLYLEKQIQDEAKMFWEMGKRLRAMYEGDEIEVVE
ncbi:hypothetical protein Ancab_002572 [Ancistrocladus abbreviatus]